MEKELPVKVGDNLKVSISGFGESGDPFIKIKDYIVFVKNMRTGVPINKIFEIKITKTLAKFGFAEIING